MGDLSRDDDEDMKHIVQQLDMTKLVEKLPQGYDTELGTIMPDSVNISGGEWQRLAIARCVYHHAPLQILDEPTASLDPVAESRHHLYHAPVRCGKTFRRGAGDR